MSDAKICDRCGDAESTTSWHRNLRATIRIERTTKAATSHAPDDYELCETCASRLEGWLGGDTHRLAAAEPRHQPDNE